jgi:hypothetical protein
LQPALVDPEDGTYQLDMPLVDPPVPQLYLREVAVGYINGPGKIDLGHFNGLPDGPNALIDGHTLSVTNLITSETHYASGIFL